MDFRKSLQKLQNSIDTAVKNNVDLKSHPDKARALYNYKENQRQYYVDSLRSSIKLVRSSIPDLMDIARHDKDSQETVSRIYELIPDLDTDDLGIVFK